MRCGTSVRTLSLISSPSDHPRDPYQPAETQHVRSHNLWKYLSSLSFTKAVQSNHLACLTSKVDQRPSDEAPTVRISTINHLISHDTSESGTLIEREKEGHYLPCVETLIFDPDACDVRWWWHEYSGGPNRRVEWWLDTGSPWLMKHRHVSLRWKGSL